MNNTQYHKVKIHPGYLPTLEISMLPELDVDFEKCTMVLGNIEQIASVLKESQMLSLIDRFNESGRYKKIEIVRDNQ